MNRTELLITRVLTLNDMATPAPWNTIEGDGSVWSDVNQDKCIANTDHCPNDKMDINAETIAYYRNRAPKLAKMLQVALDALKFYDGEFSKNATNALFKIEQMARSED